MTPADAAPAQAGASFVRTFPCVSCGAKLAFAPGTRELRCEFCGAANAIGGDEGTVEELDLATHLEALEAGQEAVEEERVRCAKCGAEEVLDGRHFATRCSFCGTAIVSASYAGRRVRPESIIPFQVTHEGAQEALRGWLRWRWLAPGDLKRYARSDASLNGVYLPFWTYDVQTDTRYRGQRGVKRDKTTHWTPVEGRIEHFHDDVLVPASTSLPDAIAGSLRTYDTSRLVPYKPEFVSGFHAEAYQRGLAEAFDTAKLMIERHIRERIRRDIGGSAQQIDAVDTRYGRFTFKHVLLPAWVSAYRYRDKVYRFVVNAQTGETDGESPVSGWKVFGLVVLGLVILYLSN